ncbi:hypothetical protein JXQ70_15280 [bacterium]|nr:hypothetical protein [bacterium]
MKKTRALLKQLVQLPGIPGREEAVADFLLKYPLETRNRAMDSSGNVWLEYDGPDKPALVLSAHMDEIGCRVKKIEEDGQLSVIGFEGIDLRTLASHVVQIWSDAGVYDAYIYLRQRTWTSPDFSDLVADNIRLDLGLRTRAQVAALSIKPNDPVTFSPDFHDLQNGTVCAKAIDNRCSLAAILLALEQTVGKRAQRPLLLGTVQEEIGGWGAHSIAFKEKPGAILVLDICGAEVFKLTEAERRTIMGRGPILLNNPGTSRGLYKRLKQLAAEQDIPCQDVGYYTRGADPAILQTKSGGQPMMSIIIPMAYYHGPKGLIDLHDLEATTRLLVAVLEDESFLDHGSPF